jgi:hypothetical protein
LSPFADEYRGKELAKRLRRAVGSKKAIQLHTPFEAASEVYPGDFVARREMQETLASSEFTGGACTNRVFAGVPLRVCIVQARQPGASARLAESWRDLHPGLLFDVALEDEVILVQTAYGARYTTQAVAAFAKDYEAALVVAGPGSPRYVKSALRGTVRRLAGRVGG